MIPFIKIVKFNGQFGQFGFNGPAILFTQDIFEVSDKLISMLPRSSSNSGIVVVTEHLENLNINRQFNIKFNSFLRGHDVRIIFCSHLLTLTIFFPFVG